MGVVVGGGGDVLMLVLSRGLLVFWFIFGATNGAWGRLGEQRWISTNASTQTWNIILD